MDLNVKFWFYGTHHNVVTSTPSTGVTIRSVVVDTTTAGWHDLEDDVKFGNVMYKQCEGLEKKGKVKNITTETYADSDKVRSYIPPLNSSNNPTITRDASTIEFTFVFTGANRQDDYQYLCDFFKRQRVVYWDTARKRGCVLLLVNATEPSKDIYIGSNPFIQAEFKFSSLTGECPIFDDKGSAYYWAHNIMNLI